jgi:hypothetical protein
MIRRSAEYGDGVSDPRVDRWSAGRANDPAQTTAIDVNNDPHCHARRSGIRVLAADQGLENRGTGK